MNDQDHAPREPEVDIVEPTDDAPHDITFRARAERAERQAAELEERIETLSSELTNAQSSAARAQFDHQLDAALYSAGAIDVETARAVAAGRIGDDSNLTPAALVQQLKREKPFLFRSPAPSHSAMSPHTDDNGASTVRAAQDAAATGDRASLLNYLRARRSA